MPRINLLPWRDQQRKEKRLAFVAALIGAAVAGAVVTFGAYVYYGSLMDAQDARNDRLRGEIKVLDKEIEEINDLDAQKQRFISRMQIIEKLQRSRPEVVHLFDEIVKEMPDGTYLTALKQSGSRLKLEGVAQSSTRVSSLMRNVSSSQWLKDPELEVVQSATNAAGNSFVLYANQVTVNTDDAAAAPKSAAAPKKGGAK
ncbi:MAG: PilN domain-containing protein [Steroidobacteraceae bacterium]